jgi:hypothetical protein
MRVFNFFSARRKGERGNDETKQVFNCIRRILPLFLPRKSQKINEANSRESVVFSPLYYYSLLNKSFSPTCREFGFLMSSVAFLVDSDATTRNVSRTTREKWTEMSFLASSRSYPAPKIEIALFSHPDFSLAMIEGRAGLKSSMVPAI